MRSLGTIRARVERLARVQVQREAGEDPPGSERRASGAKRSQEAGGGVRDALHRLSTRP
jgi:hypothetical protein